MIGKEKTITVLVPCFNEEKGLPLLYRKVTEVMAKLPGYRMELLLVDDGSSDGTVDAMRELRRQDARVCWLSLSRNFGKETAMLAGLDYAAGDAVIFMDADLQDPPEIIPDLVAEWEKGYVDVYARRRRRMGESAFKKGSAWLYYRLLRMVSSIDIPADVGDFRLLDRQAVDALKSIRERQRYTKGLFSWIGFHKKEILFDRAPRAVGNSRMGFMKLLRLAIQGFLSFSVAPLRMASVLGGIFALLAMAGMVFVVVRALLHGDPVAGWPSLVSIILFIGGIQLMVLGIIGEYLGSVFLETKGRPPYLAWEYNGEKVMP